MTFDTTSPLDRPANPRRTPNARRPYFDLDSVYGDGPSGSPQLYEAADHAKFRVESGGYVLREGDLFGQGAHLSPVGGRR